MFNCLTKEEQEQAIKEMYKKFGMEYKGNHQVIEPKNLLFKDFKPKYPKIECYGKKMGIWMVLYVITIWLDIDMAIDKYYHMLTMKIQEQQVYGLGV